MRAEILDRAVAFEVQPEARPDGSWEPPAEVTLTLRPCWRKPPVRLRVAYLYTYEQVAYYAEEL
ncbi:MAG TPA: hypothetical protein VE030_11080 [Burkholderiales bacterium]|nr:hypothetical protein [Burkholderiales bacterium]